MIRKLLLSTVALCAVSSAAFAADLPSRRAPPVYVPPPIPVFSWTGFYVGGQIGFGFGEDRTTNVRTALNPGLTRVQHPNGLIGGGHVGYNFAGLPGVGGIGGFGGGGLVFGVEGDIDGTDYRDTFGVTTLRNQIQGSARGRIGIAVDRALFYVTGGGAFAQFQTTYALPAQYNSFSHTRAGWVVGGGVEYAITTQWSLRAQYLYSDYGSYNDFLSNGAIIQRRETLQKAQVGFSYKFDTPIAAPVVARY